MIKLAILGFGSRGQMFSRLIALDKDAQLVAVAEPVAENMEKAKQKFELDDSMCFSSAEEFFKVGKICDAIIICTQDNQHYLHTLAALNLGYDICLEKPAAISIEQCIEIRDLANKLNRKVMLTHVLRYAPFYQIMKQKIDSGELGKIVTINQTENIAFWHFALSYVRGPWSNMDESTPTILAKCSHDLDIINWLMSKKCIAVSSFGDLAYYNIKNAPKGSSHYCIDCSADVREKCLYDAFKIDNKFIFC